MTLNAEGICLDGPVLEVTVFPLPVGTREDCYLGSDFSTVLEDLYLLLDSSLLGVVDEDFFNLASASNRKLDFFGFDEATEEEEERLFSPGFT